MPDTLSERARSWFRVRRVGVFIGYAIVAVFSYVVALSVVADPDSVFTNPSLATAYEMLAFQSIHSFLVPLGAGVIAMIALSNDISALAQYGIHRFSWGMHHRFSVRLLTGCLAQPYSFFTTKNSATLNETLLNECQEVIRNVMPRRLCWI